MFVGFFASFIFALTSFQLFFWGLVFFVLFGIGIWVYWLVSKRSFSLGKNFLLLSGAFVLANLACIVFWWRSNPVILSDFFSFTPTKLDSKRTTTLAQYTISEQTKPDTYLVESASGATFLLKSHQNLQVGGNYQIGARYKPLNIANTYSQLTETKSESGFSFGDFLDYEFNYDKWLLMKGYQGSLYLNFSVYKGENDQLSFFEKTVQNIRISLKELISKVFPDKKGGLLLAMLIGDKSGLPKQDYQHFIDSGIVHIIAVSGGNLVMIVVFLGAVLFWLPFYVRNACIIFGVIFFAVLAGNDSSVVRALIMSVLSLIALFWGREIQIWRLLKYAFVLMLCYNPYFLAYDLGFLLSFGALIGIVVLSEVLSTGTASENQKKEKKSGIRFLTSFFKNYGIPTLGASIGTLPVLLFFIGTTNLSGILINLVIVPLVPLITIGGFISAVLASIMNISWLSSPIVWLLEFIYYCSDLANRFSLKMSIDHLRAKYAFALLVIGLLICCYLLVRKRDE